MACLERTLVGVHGRGGAGALTLPTRKAQTLLARRCVPMAHHLREFADAGGLMAYGPERADLYRRAATYVDRILKRMKPADLPTEQPTKVRAGHEPQNGKGDGPPDRAVVLVAGRPGDRAVLLAVLTPPAGCDG